MCMYSTVVQRFRLQLKSENVFLKNKPLSIKKNKKLHQLIGRILYRILFDKDGRLVKYDHFAKQKYKNLNRIIIYFIQVYFSKIYENTTDV